MTSAAGATALFTTAPAAVSIPAGGTASFTIGGGVAPYSSTSGNPAVLGATVSGSALTLMGVSAGTAQLVVLDAVGKSVTISATVGTVAALFTTAPSSVAVAVGGTVNYLIGGGTGPYSAASSNPAAAAASVTGSTLNINGIAAGAAQIAVVDATGKSVPVNVTVGTVTALYSTAPSTLNIAAGTASSYLVGGGTAPYLATSSNTAAVVTSVTGTALNVIGLGPGAAQISVVDAVGKTVSINVTVGNAPAMFTSAASTIAVTPGSSSNFTVGGGSAPYMASSSNTAVLTISVSGTGLTINGIAPGSGQATVVDAAGKSISINVSVGTTTSLYTTAAKAIVVANGATATFAIGGGTGPYLATSSNPAVLTSAVAGTALTVNGVSAGTGQVIVHDSVGNSVAIDVTVGNVTALFTSAPGTVSIASGASTNYAIGGGAAPYQATSSNALAATASVAGSTLTINGGAPGTAQVSLVDAVGKVVNISVTVGTVADLFTTAPSAITLASGAAPNYILGGGTPPYSATSSNTSDVTASVSGTTLNLRAIAAGSAQVAVVDSAGKTVNLGVTVLPVAGTVLDVEPHGAVANVGDVLTFRVSGGKPGYTVSVNNPSVAAITAASLSSSGDMVTASLVNAGTTTVTVVDGAGATFGFNIVVNQATPLMRLSPSQIDVAESFLDPLVFNIYGGKGPYRAFTSDLQKSSVTVSGTLLTVGLGTAGTRCFPSPVNPADPHGTYDVTITVVDSLGASATSIMKIQDNLNSTVCP